MKAVLVPVLAALAAHCVLGEASTVRYSTKPNEAADDDKPTVVTLESPRPKSGNNSRPRGVFIFDDNCLWYLHGKGKLIAKINCVTPKKDAPLIVATRRNGRLHYRLHKGPMRPGRLASRRRIPKVGQIPLKCFYRYDDKGVFYLTRCYTRSPGYGPVEMNFHGHLPNDKKSGKKDAGCRSPRCRKKRMKKKLQKLRRHRRRLIARRAPNGSASFLFRRPHHKKYHRKGRRKHHKKHHKKGKKSSHKKGKKSSHKKGRKVHHKKGRKPHHKRGKKHSDRSKLHKPERKKAKE